MLGLGQHMMFLTKSLKLKKFVPNLLQKKTLKTLRQNLTKLPNRTKEYLTNQKLNNLKRKRNKPNKLNLRKRIDNSLLSSKIYKLVISLKKFNDELKVLFKYLFKKKKFLTSPLFFYKNMTL